MLEQISNDNEFLHRVFFSDECTFHVSEAVNRHNFQIRGSQNPHVIREIKRDSPKINVWCDLYVQQLIGPFEKTVNETVYWGIMQFHRYQMVIFSNKMGLLHIMPILSGIRSSMVVGLFLDLTPLDFFLWRYIKDIVFRTPVTVPYTHTTLPTTHSW